ncbi:MAG: hypothetical protein ACRDD7_13960 [Peptostreptococcaceae bacterium]
MKDKIKEILIDNLDSVYCDTCNGVNCDECIRKSMGWGISSNEAEYIADKILEIIK